MKLRTFFVISLFVLQMPVFAADFFSIGVKGGVSLTDSFENQTLMGVDTHTHLYSPSKDYIVGPMVEVHLPFGIGVEADALYRSMSLRGDFTVLPNFSTTIKGDTHAWEFPILARYRMPFPIVKPFVELGPSFRDVAQIAGATSPQLSAKGITAGIGTEVHVPLVKISPEIRYTRWGKDTVTSFGSFNPTSKRDQVEFLVGIGF